MESDSDTERPQSQDEKKVKSRRPPNNAFRQQRLKAWQPILTPRTVLPLFFSVAALFALFGGLLIWSSVIVQEIVIDYTQCAYQATSDFSDMKSSDILYHFKDNSSPRHATQWKFVNGTDSNNEPVCTLRFDIPTEMGSPIYMFYRMTNFYQNHRRYVLSYNENQLEGKPETNKTLKDKDDCKPLILAPDGRPYYPCGLIANSLFNDTFASPVNEENGTTYDMTTNGIAWPTDRNRFKKTQYNNSQVVPPRNWAKMYPDGYTDENPIPDISQWEEFQNWMRTAALPTFSKLARRNDTTALQPGTYAVDIVQNFDTTLYRGKKMLVLSTRSAIGGRNNFLGIAYVVVAGLCAALGIVFLIQHLVKPRRMGDHTYLSWNSERK